MALAFSMGIGEGDEEDEDGPLPILDDLNKSRRMAEYWKGQIVQCDEVNKGWHKRGHTILLRYRDERNRIVEENQRRLNILWANVQILRPALYGKTPQPIIERKFLDRDPTGRTSAMILERVVRNEIEENGFHHAIRRAVDDMLLPGRGQVWVRYEPEIGESISLPVASQADLEDDQGLIIDDEDDEETEKLEETGEEVVAESIPVDYVPWQDFYIFPAHARTWNEVQAIGKKVPVTKEGCIDRFGEEIGEKIQPDPTEQREDKKTETNMAVIHDVDEKDRLIYEIWCKSDRTVYWVSNGYEYLCDARKDPLGLRSFFPCPEPLSATLTNDTMIPIADYLEYQDQAIQIDELTQRINMLAKAVKVCGTYDSSNRALRRLLEEDTENTLIPVDNYAAFVQSGGLKEAVSFMPIDPQIEALKVLIEVRQGMLEDIDRITGISDILRGTSDARETLGAQRLKTNNSGTRLDERRSDVARFARDVIRLIAEIAAKHFTEKTLIEASGILYEDEFQPGAQQSQQGAPGQPPQPPGPPQGLPPPNPQGPGMALPAPNPGLPGPMAMPHPPPMLPPPGPMAGPMGAPAMPGPMAGGMPPQMPPRLGLPVPAGAPPSPMPGGPGPAMAQPQPQMNVFANMLQTVAKITKAIELLRRDVTRGYRIEVEADSMIAGDIEEERAAAVEFITGVTNFLGGAEKLVMGDPNLKPLLGKFLQWGVRKFRTGRDLENAIDEYVDRLQKTAQAAENAPPPPDPKMELEKAKIQSEQMRAQTEMAKAQLDMRAQAANDQRDQARQAQEHAAWLQKTQQEQAKAAQDHQMDMARMAQEADMQREEHAMKMQELAIKIMHSQEKTNVAAPKDTLVGQHTEHFNKMASVANTINDAVKRHEANMRSDAEGRQRYMDFHNSHAARLEHAVNGFRQAANLHHTAMNTPRHIVRGPDGKAVGLMPVAPQPPMQPQPAPMGAQ